MKKQEDANSQLQELRKIQANKKCFDCGQGGTTYAVPEIGIFLCSLCGGIHREFNHRVKGLSTCNFTESEVAKLRAIGNERAASIWMAKHDLRQYPIPDIKDVNRLKDFLRLKYLERRFYEFKEKTNEKPKQEEYRSAEIKSENRSGFINLIDDQPEPSRKSDIAASNTLLQSSFPNGTFQAQRISQSKPVPSQNTPFNAFPPPGTQNLNPQGVISPPSQNNFVPVSHSNIKNPGNSGSYTPTGQSVSGFPNPQINPVNPNTLAPAPANQPNPRFLPNPNPSPSPYPYPQPNPVSSFPNNPGNIYNNTGYSFNPPNQVSFSAYTQVQSYPIYPNRSVTPTLPARPQFAGPNTQYQSISPTIMPNNQQAFFKSSDPFEQLIEEEKQRKMIQQASRNQPTPQQQLLMQQYNVQAQLYERNNGVPCPFTFQQWLSLNGQEIRPQSKNPFG